MRYFVITWRPPGGELYFFRGDSRYEIFLPYISEKVVSRGWVRDEAYARVFDGFPVFTSRSFAKNFIMSRLNVYPYKGQIQPTHILRPIRRPQHHPQAPTK